MKPEEVTKILTDTFTNLNFEPINHIYHLNGSELQPVTQKLKNYYEEFDVETIAPFSAKKWNKANPDKAPKTAKDIKEEWRATGKAASNRGKKIHTFAQNYNISQEPSSKEEHGIANWFSQNPHPTVAIELAVYTDNYAGTIDRILYNETTNALIVVDFKTNLDLYKNFNNKKLLPPFNHLLDNPFNKYQIQLNLYKKPIELMTPFKVEKMSVVWLHEDLTDYYKEIEVEDLTHILNEQI